ncbi:MAG: minor capsid protein [Candidatus Methanomethylophilaceae archaeon]|nr:minor capsid protein [Candidatus Methanomethylophilaceae archaeon]
MTLDKLDRRDVMAMQSSASEALPGTVRTMMRAMRRAEVRCIKTMDDILTAYQKHGGFETRAEARTWLETKSDPKTIARLRKEAMSIKDPDERKLFLNRLDSPAYRYRMKNREAVIQSAKIAVADVRPDTAKTLGVSCSKVYTESELRTAYNVQRTANVGIDFTMVDKYALKQAMDTDYSQVSKYVAEEYGDELAARIQAGILSGESVDKMAKGIEEITDGELWKCKRIARTELSKAANKGSLDQMEKYGIKRFEFVCTLDIEKTCDVCGNMDGRTYDVADAQPGVNMPPMHPNCRCHIVSYMTNEAKRKLQRTYRDPNTGKPQSVPRDMTYREWMKQYAPEEYAKRYEGLQHTEKMRIEPVKAVEPVTDPRAMRYTKEAEKERINNMHNMEIEREHAVNMARKRALSDALDDNRITREQYRAAMDKVELYEEQLNNGGAVIDSSAFNKGLDPVAVRSMGSKPTEEWSRWSEEHPGFMIRGIAKDKVEYRTVAMNSTELTEEQIIEKLAGPDRTSGSCVSQALSYIGNKAGMDVKDYRGGESRRLFASGGWYNVMRATSPMEYIGVSESKKLLKAMEPGKEYFFISGRHCAITRMGAEGPEYLELQDMIGNNGWKKFDFTRGHNTLRERFGVSGRSMGGMVDIQEIENREDILETLGYINTEADKMKMGAGGGIK